MSGRTVTILCDNAPGPELGGEWGLAMALDLGPDDDGPAPWLWDTGQTDLSVRNARALGVDLAAARGLALSHGHYDHTGGLDALLAAGFRGAIHAHPACARKRFAEEPNGKPRRPIGPPRPLPEFIPSGPVTRLAPGLTLITDIPRADGAFQAVRGFTWDLAGREPDNVPDDAFLVMDSDSGPVVILGCCHSGLGNSLAAARERLGLTEAFAVLGGLHLYAAGPEAIAETAQALRGFDVKRLITGHCTGADRLPVLAALLPDTRVEALRSGLVIRF
jgi:7,8-dihydropterin-6-yl-methyl-4-(beta-D-ribofuranosyl)aminobenzene 5'-phosphate synthase